MVAQARAEAVDSALEARVEGAEVADVPEWNLRLQCWGGHVVVKVPRVVKPLSVASNIYDALPLG